MSCMCYIVGEHPGLTEEEIYPGGEMNVAMFADWIMEQIIDCAEDEEFKDTCRECGFCEHYGSFTLRGKTV